APAAFTACRLHGGRCRSRRCGRISAGAGRRSATRNSTRRSPALRARTSRPRSREPGHDFYRLWITRELEMSGSGKAPGGDDRRGKVPREEGISRRAYEKWDREGRPHGRDRDHWRDAERELAGDDPAAPGAPREPERRGDGARRQTPPGLEPGAPAAATATGG